MGHFAAEPDADGGGEFIASKYIAAQMGSADLCGVGSLPSGGVGSGAEFIVLDALTVSIGRGANGHSKELFLPGTVKSCSSTVEREVRRADSLILLLPPDILVNPVDFPPDPESHWAAFLPSRMATAVCCFEDTRFRRGRGTKPARSELATWSGGSCSFATMLDISGSDGAYLSARV